MISLPDSSVRRIGSVTELMMLYSRWRSRSRPGSAVTLRRRSAWNFSPSTSANHSTSSSMLGLVALEEQNAERRELVVGSNWNGVEGRVFQRGLGLCESRGESVRAAPLQATATSGSRRSSMSSTNSPVRAVDKPSAATPQSRPGSMRRRCQQGAPGGDMLSQPLESLLRADRRIHAAQKELGQREFDLGVDHVVGARLRRGASTGALARDSFALDEIRIGDQHVRGGRFERRARGGRDLSDRLGVLQIGVDRGYHHTRFNRDEVDAHQRHPDPGVDDDAFVQDTIEDVDKTCSTCSSFNGHCLLHVGLRGPRVFRARAAPFAAAARGRRFEAGGRRTHDGRAQPAFERGDALLESIALGRAGAAGRR